MNKTIVVLANSKKPGGRCLAGKELIRNGDLWEIGSWIRPVTSDSSGAVPDYQMSMALGRGLGHMPRLLEIIEIPFARPAPMPDQPENWLVEFPLKARLWHAHGTFAWKDVSTLLDHPSTLWTEQANSRRVKSGYVQRMKNPASLYLIKPEGILDIRIWSEPSQYTQTGVKRRRRTTIRYAGINHEFDIDDVDFERRYYSKFPGLNDATVYPKLPKPDETIVCTSLALEHVDHYHYKIAAAFLEPPE
jgi:hypothetical protein